MSMLEIGHQNLVILFIKFVLFFSAKSIKLSVISITSQQKVNVFSMKSKCKLMFGTSNFVYQHYAQHHTNCSTYLNGFLIDARPLLLGINSGFFHAEIMLGQKPIWGRTAAYIVSFDMNLNLENSFNTIFLKFCKN